MVLLNLKAKKEVDIYKLNEQFNILCTLFAPLRNVYVYVCCSQMEMKKCLKIKSTNLPNWVVGINHNKKIAVLNKYVLNCKGFNINEICEHEMVHIFVNHFIPDCPLWINEGLAQNVILDKADHTSCCILPKGNYLPNPYNLSYDSNLYYVSNIIIKKLFEKYGFFYIINQLKNCINFEHHNIFGYNAIEKFILSLYN